MNEISWVLSLVLKTFSIIFLECLVRFKTKNKKCLKSSQCSSQELFWIILDLWEFKNIIIEIIISNETQKLNASFLENQKPQKISEISRHGIFKELIKIFHYSWSSWCVWSLRSLVLKLFGNFTNRIVFILQQDTSEPTIRVIVQPFEDSRHFLFVSFETNKIFSKNSKHSLGN
jgi:hypothetical protein